MKAIWLLALFLCIKNCNGRHFLDSLFHRYKPRMPFVESKLSDQGCKDDPHYADKCPEMAAQNNYCKDQEKFMKKNCPKSCGFCSEGTKAPAPVVCEDDPNYADKCAEKAAIKDYCKDQKKFMEKECPKSCGFCSSDTQKPPAPAICEDDPNYADMCAKKAAIKDYCVHQKEFMEKECPKSCGLCSSSTQKPPAPAVCEDDPNYADKCAEKAAIKDYCVDQKKFMEKECPKSCGFCP